MKGAKGIAILAPCIYRRKTEPDNDGSQTVTRLSGFKTAYVFDMADTAGDPLPTLVYAAADGGEELLARLEWTTEEELNIRLDYEEIREHGVDGYSAGGRIVVRTSLSPTAKASVLLHEISHLCCVGIYVVMSVLERASRRGTVFNHHIIGQGEAEPGGN